MITVFYYCDQLVSFLSHSIQKIWEIVFSILQKWYLTSSMPDVHITRCAYNRVALALHSLKEPWLKKSESHVSNWEFIKIIIPQITFYQSKNQVKLFEVQSFNGEISDITLDTTINSIKNSNIETKPCALWWYYSSKFGEDYPHNTVSVVTEWRNL